MSFPLEFALNICLKLGFKLFRVSGIACVCVHTDGDVFALVPTTRGRSGFNGCTIAYLDPTSADLLLLDTDCSQTLHEVTRMRKEKLLGHAEPTDFLSMVQSWQKRSEFVTIDVPINVPLLQTEGYRAVRAFPVIEPQPEVSRVPVLVEQPVVAAAPQQQQEPPPEKKKRLFEELVGDLKRRKVTLPAKLREFNLATTAVGTTALTEVKKNPTEQ